MPAHLTLDSITCDPSVVPAASGGFANVSIKVTNDGDADADANFIVRITDEQGNEVFSDSNSSTIAPGTFDLQSFSADTAFFTQPGTYTASIGVEGAGESQGGSCQFTVQ
jgi:hypothetical protein